MLFDDDLSFFFADFGKTAVYTPRAGGASVTGRVMFSQPAADVMGGDFLTESLSARYVVADFPAMRRGDRLVIAGVAHELREDPRPLMDGLENTVSLKRV